MTTGKHRTEYQDLSRAEDAFAAPLSVLRDERNNCHRRRGTPADSSRQYFVCLPNTSVSLRESGVWRSNAMRGVRIVIVQTMRMALRGVAFLRNRPRLRTMCHDVRDRQQTSQLSSCGLNRGSISGIENMRTKSFFDASRKTPVTTLRDFLQTTYLVNMIIETLKRSRAAEYEFGTSAKVGGVS